MTATRLTGIPISHVTAEMVAYPLASTAALQLACCRLDPSLKSDSTCQLWRAAEQSIIRTLPGFSIDEGVAIRDKVWFGDCYGSRSDQPVLLHHYLRRVVTNNLELMGSVAVPRLHPDELRLNLDSQKSREALSRWRWRWLSLALPPDLLLAAMPVGSEPTPLRVDCVSRLIDRQLADGGFAETHLHLGAALDFPLLWVLILRAIAEPALHPDQFASPGAVLEEGRQIGPWLIRAATMRYLLAAYLTPAQSQRSFREFLDCQVRSCLTPVTGASYYSLLLQGIADLQAGDIGTPDRIDFGWWQALYRQLTGIDLTRVPESRGDALEIDPVSGLLPTRYPHRETAETRFVVAVLTHLDRLDQRGQEDKLFTRLFWQVVRVRNLVYRHLVQRPMTPGLQWFIRFYDRMRPARRLASYRLRLDAARAICGGGQGLTSLEIRTSPETSLSRVFTELRQMEKIIGEWQQQPSLPLSQPAVTGLEFGVIYHFSKNRGGGALEGQPQAHWMDSHADPKAKSNPTRYRYAGYYHQKEREALALIWVLHNLPATVEIIRGIDVCTDEMGVPFWVLAPILRAVRRAGDEAVRALEIHCNIEVPSLRTTVHSGEDFVHLLTGLRHIDESINLFELREGDRLGHAMALGVDARDWALRAGRIAMPREVRLFDLVWEWGYYRCSGTPVPKRRRTLLESEVTRLSEIIFNERCDYHDLTQLTEDLHNGLRLWETGFPNGPLPARWWPATDRHTNETRTPCKRDRLLLSYLTDLRTFQEGRVIEWVDPAAEGEILAEIQNGLRRLINARSFTIEVNPSSNLLIGDLGNLDRHPLWRLYPPHGGTDELPLPLCIGSDDPLTFGTSLPYEYQLVYDALLLAGVSGEDARAWLDNARVRGLEARFTLPARHIPDILALRQITPTQPPLVLPR